MGTAATEGHGGEGGSGYWVLGGQVPLYFEWRRFLLFAGSSVRHLFVFFTSRSLVFVRLMRNSLFARVPVRPCDEMAPRLIVWHGRRGCVLPKVII